MSTDKPGENWLTQEGSEGLDQAWRDRVVVILQDLVNLPHLKFAYVISGEGVRLTKFLGQGGEELESMEHDHKAYFHLADVVEEYLKNLGIDAPAHVTVEMEEDMLFVGSAGQLILVAAFEGNVARGYMSMKLTKRISHLRTLFRTRERGGLYV